MPSSLIRGKYVICKVTGRHEAQVIEDGAVFQRDGVIVKIGPYPELAAKYRADETVGSSDHIVLPGFINSHHHLGLTPLQMGSPDHPLELWWASKLAKRDVDLYLDTLHSAFEMIESGITTVQHMHTRVNGPLKRIEEAANRVIKAYEDVGMRVSYSFGMRDQNRLVYESDEQFVKRLPPDIASDMAEMLRAQTIPLEDNFQLFESLHRQHNHKERVRIQLAPANLHWCTDRSLEMVRDYADRYHVPVHLHLLESMFQKEYAQRRSGTTAVRHIHDLGLLGPGLTLGHGVWVTEADIELIAGTGTRICHNASSNLRLRSGIAPLNYYLGCGVPVALGLDEAGINDDKDILQEMRLVLRLHRVPGMDDVVPTPAEVLRMATEHGAHTTAFGSHLGTLEPGKAADIVIMNWRHIAYPYLDADVPVVDAVVQRARTHGVETVLVAGEPILLDRRFTRVDKKQAQEELARSLRAPLAPHEERRRELSRRVFPYFRQFYADEGYLSKCEHEPYYKTSSRF
ncbi:MAG: amidohydrolase family protein [Betaproteobacteria bacterium]|nr:amidohydrolase family protein [Betaproteobacteria bacterium]